jgi:tripartite-type tricarboxylate transporter receptor subunit TctC
MKRVLCWTLILLLIAGIGSAAADKTYPLRTITNIVIWPHGSRTDLLNRLVSAEMSRTLRENIHVINRAGGKAGISGMNYAYARAADGYTVCGLSEENAAGVVSGRWQRRLNVWDFFIIGGSPEVISINPQLQIDTLEELIAAARKAPQKLRAAVHYGSVHRLNLTALEKASGAKFQPAYFPDSFAAYSATADGRAAFVFGPLAEQLQLIRRGKLKPLAVFAKKPFRLKDFGKIPAASADLPALSKQDTVAETIAFAVPSDTPANIKTVLKRAFEKALASPRVKNWSEVHATRLSGKTGKRAQAEFAAIESVVAWALWEQGIAKQDPKTLGIPKP